MKKVVKKVISLIILICMVTGFFTLNTPVASAAGETPPTDGLQMWLKADVGVTADTNGHVSNWANQASTAGRLEGIQSTDVSMPLLITDSMNSKPVLRFGVRDGNAAFMNISGFGDTDADVDIDNSINMSSYSVAFLMKPIELMDFNEAIYASNSSGGQEFTFHSQANGGIYTGIAIKDEQRFNNWDNSTTGALMNKRWDRVFFTYNNATGKGSLYVNGVLTKSGAMRSPNSWSTLSIGNDNAQYGINCDLAELMVYNRALTQGEITTIDTYLTNKFPNRGPEPDPIPEASNLPVFNALTTLYTDTFENPEGNDTLSYWDNSSSTSSIINEAGNKVLQVGLKVNESWPGATRYLYKKMSGKVVFKYKLKMEDLAAFKVLPRFVSDTGGTLGQVFFDQNADKLVVQGLNGGAVDVNGGSNIQANQWYEMSVEMNTDTQQIAAWVGTEPQQKTYIGFTSTQNNVNGMMFILTGTDNDNWSKEKGSIYLDDVSVMAPGGSALPMKNAYTENFESVATDSLPDGWLADSSISKVIDDSGNKVMNLKVKESIPWPELNKSLPIPLSGGITLKMKVKLDKLDTLKTLPRLFGGDNESAIGDIMYDHIKKDIEVVGKQKFYVSGDADSKIEANKWFDLTIQLDTESHVMTAWIGNEPATKKYVQFKNDVNDFQIMSFILINTTFGPNPGDGFYGIPETGGVSIDDINVSYIDKPGALLEGSTLPEFSDITGSPAKNDITFLAIKGIIGASNDGTFGPDGSISVDDFIKWIVEAKGFTSESNYMQKAIALGFVDEGEFIDGSRPITRGEMLKIAVRATSEQFPTIMDRYIPQITDYSSIGDEFKTFAAKAFAIGIVDGTKEFEIKAGNNATRAEAATTVARVLDLNRRIPAVAVQQELFVDSENGNDQNPGTNSQPFKTIEKARDQVRTINSDLNGDIIVWLKGINYNISNTLTFGSSDSGTNGFNVVYMAYPDQTPAISGGKQIKNWTLYKDGIYKASAQGLDFRQLYVNGGRAVRARTPNKENADNLGPYNRLVDWDKVNKKIIVKTEDISNWMNLTNAEMIVKKHWDQSIFRIASTEIDGENAYITPMDPERTLEFVYCIEPFKMPDDTYYFENSLEFLDSEGEWYLDKSANTVYYKPHSNENINNLNIVAPALEQLVEFNGASHVKFINTVFENTGHVLGDSGRVSLQSGSQLTGDAMWDITFIHGGVRLQNADYITFQGDTFRNMGGVGIELVQGTHDNIINGCTIRDIGNSGILVYSNIDNTNAKNNNPPDADKCMNDRITNNYITRVGQDFTGASGICVTYGTGTVIEHNEICYTPYNGINVGWGWTSETTALRDNMVRYNNVHDVMQLHDDSAGIYTLSKQPGTVISENWSHDIKKSDWAENNQVAGIYLDNQSEGITLNRNVIENVPKNIHLNTQTPNIFINNRMILQWVKDFSGPKDYLVNNSYKLTQNTPTGTGGTSDTTAGNGNNGTTTTSQGQIVSTPVKDGDTAKSSVDEKTLTQAFEDVKADAEGVKTVVLEAKATDGVNEYQQSLPVDVLTASKDEKKVIDQKIKIKTPLGELTVPENMFKESDVKGATNVGLTIGKADVSNLDSNIKEKIGSKPVLELNALVDGKTIKWNNPNAPVTVSVNLAAMDYQLSTEEKAHPDNITIWYIDGNGKANKVPNAKYDAATGNVSFITTHFSKYAVVYEMKTFTDAGKYSWAKTPIEVLASKGIMEGTSETKFSPDANISRGEFVAVLVRALGLNAEFTKNFSDIKSSDLYYNEIGVAKALGIARGSEKEIFNPNRPITREQMSAFVMRALDTLGKVYKAGSSDDLKKFKDASKVSVDFKLNLATLVREGILLGDGVNITPKGNLTRAQTAKVVYGIFKKWM